MTSAREHIYDLRSLENYTFVDENGKDQGINVRHKMRDLIEFIQNDDRLREERKKAKKNKDKYIGMSSDTTGGMRNFDDFRHRENYSSNSSRSNNEEKGCKFSFINLFMQLKIIFLINLDSDQNTENDYHYDSYEREDSDNETNGNRNSSK